MKQATATATNTTMKPATGHTGLRHMATRFNFQLSSPQPGGRSLDSSKSEAAYVGFHKTFHDRL